MNLRKQDALGLAEQVVWEAIAAYRAISGGLGFVHASYGSDWAGEIDTARDQVFRAFSHFLREEPGAERLRRVTGWLLAEDLLAPRAA